MCMLLKQIDEPTGRNDQITFSSMFPCSNYRCMMVNDDMLYMMDWIQI